MIIQIGSGFDEKFYLEISNTDIIIMSKYMNFMFWLTYRYWMRHVKFGIGKFFRIWYF